MAGLLLVLWLVEAVIYYISSQYPVDGLFFIGFVSEPDDWREFNEQALLPFTNLNAGQGEGAVEGGFAMGTDGLVVLNRGN